jgi:hypothetical protein
VPVVVRHAVGEGIDHVVRKAGFGVGSSSSPRSSERRAAGVSPSVVSSVCMTSWGGGEAGGCGSGFVCLKAGGVVNC